MKIRYVTLLATIIFFLTACSKEDGSASLKGTKWTSDRTSNSVFVIEFNSERNFKGYITDKEGNINSLSAFNGTYNYGLSLVTFYCDNSVTDPPKRAALNGTVLYVEYKSGIQRPFYKK